MIVTDRVPLGELAEVGQIALRPERIRTALAAVVAENNPIQRAADLVPAVERIRELLAG